MGFWIRNIIFGCILIGLAVYFFVNQDLMMSLEKEVVKNTQTADVMKTDNIAIPSTPTPKKKPAVVENKAAKGLSKFYANINGDNIGKNGPTIRNNIVYLPDLVDDLELLLDARMDSVSAYPKGWQGTTESRAFRLGETLFTKLAEYSETDKLKVFWRLNRDFVVKDAFRINKNIIKTALQVGQGIEGHFQNGVSVYFCYQSRSLVFIEGTKSYLNERCSLLKRRDNY